MADRPDIPVELRRRLFIEAGHRCAIPTCRQVSPLQIDHIDDWARVKEHSFENMIVLCANCHGRKGNRPGQVDRKSLRQYKANLAIINSRYSDFERRVLEVLADQREVMLRKLTEDGTPLAHDWVRGLSVPIPGSLRIMMLYLLKDGYVEIAPPGTNYVSVLGSDITHVQAFPPLNGHLPDIEYYRLTSSGMEFLEAWVGAKPLDAEPTDSIDLGIGDEFG